MTTNITTVTAKGQVTIPKAIREALGITAGDQLLFAVDGDRAVVTPLPRRPLDELYGALPATRPYSGQEAIREEVRRELGQRLSRGDE